MAYSSSFLKKQSSEWVDDQSIGSCSICLIVYDEVKVPKLLNCGHTFCLDCTQSLMAQQTIIKCPTCRHETDATAAPLPTNYELAEVLMKLAERQAEARKGEVTCQECFSAIAHQKVRCCRTCNTPSSGQICSDCCVENHNGHELVALVKYFEQQCKELIDTAEEHRNTVASLQTKIETQHEDINLLLSKIQSLVHILRQTLDHKATSIAQDLNDVGAENKLDILQQQKTSELGLFSSTEAILNEIVVFNDQILAIETAAIDKLNVTAERERGGSNEEYLSAFALNDDEQSSTHSAFHSLDSMRENMEAVQAEAAASCSAEGKDLISLANEATSTNETKVECNGDIEEVIANYSYVAQKDDELTLQKGERINVTEKPEQHWWIGRLQDGRIGYFPSNYVMPVTPLSSWT